MLRFVKLDNYDFLCKILTWILTIEYFDSKAFPHRIIKGTPRHLSLFIKRTIVANVAVVESSGTVSSSLQLESGFRN
jgi:hypothetical protein